MNSNPPDNREFRFEYQPPAIRFGADTVETHLGSELRRLGAANALVVCGKNVGRSPAVMGPIRTGLGEHIAGVFDQTTPAKRLETALAGAREFAAADADALVAVGGGSSLDVATVIRILARTDRSEAAIREEFTETGTLATPEDSLPAMVAIPTTLAGADLSSMAGITHRPGGATDSPKHGGVGGERLLPAVVWYDPTLVGTTPRSVLTGSAMNGFDKGIETLYARNRTPITDATAMRGLECLVQSLPTLTDEHRGWDLETILEGIILVQYGISRGNESTLSLIHAFGHGLRAHTDCHQGKAHAIVAPPALELLFERVDGRRHLLARALGFDPAGEDPMVIADAVVDRVATLRDRLHLPATLQAIDGLERSDLAAIASITRNDYLMANTPPHFEPTAEDLQGVLERVW